MNTHDPGHTDLAGKQNVLARLGHRAVGRGNHEDRTVHLGGTRDHVLDVVGVTGAVHVRIVALFGGILHVCGRNGDTAFALFRCVVDAVERTDRGQTLLCQHHGDRRSERGLAMIDVADRADVQVWLVTREFLFCHCSSPLDRRGYYAVAEFLPLIFSMMASAMLFGVSS